MTPGFLIYMTVFPVILVAIALLFRAKRIWTAVPIMFIAAMVLGMGTGVAKTVQAMMIYGTEDPELLRNGLDDAFWNALYGADKPLLIAAILFLLIRHLRKSRKTQPAAPSE